jgi:hypothetical protein
MTRSETRASSLTGAVVCVSSNGKERERRRLSLTCGGDWARDDSFYAIKSRELFETAYSAGESYNSDNHCRFFSEAGRHTGNVISISPALVRSL